MNDQLSFTGVVTMLPEKNTLPDAQHQCAGNIRDRQAGRRQHRLDMRWHIVRTFLGMGIEGIMTWHQTVQPGLHIVAGEDVGVFLNQQTGRGMLDEQCTETILPPRLLRLGSEQIVDHGADLVQTATTGTNTDILDHGNIPADMKNRLHFSFRVRRHTNQYQQPGRGQFSTSRRLPPIFALMLALPAWLATGAALAETGRPTPPGAHHNDSSSDCNACHTADRTRLRSRDSRYCQRCHENDVTASDDHGLSGAPAETPPPPAPLVDANAGLVGPLYYEDSRHGPTPNEMIRIASGPFIMGSDNRLADEGPEHTVELPTYWIDRYEVTNLQYEAFIDDTGHRSPSHFRNRSHPAGKADHPVTFVSWHDARDYCRWAGKRLPSEQEWEKAARGTDGRTYPWGNEFSIDRANTPVRWARLKRQGDTTPIGAFPAGDSPYGLADMSGNVWEWTSSWYLPHPGNRQPSENYGKIYKLLKGGSWWDCSFYKCGISSPTFNRSFFNPRVRNSSFGFRCASDHPVTPVSKEGS